MKLKVISYSNNDCLQYVVCICSEEEFEKKIQELKDLYILSGETIVRESKDSGNYMIDFGADKGYIYSGNMELNEINL